MALDVPGSRVEGGDLESCWLSPDMFTKVALVNVSSAVRGVKELKSGCRRRVGSQKQARRVIELD